MAIKSKRPGLTHEAMLVILEELRQRLKTVEAEQDQTLRLLSHLAYEVSRLKQPTRPSPTG